MLCVVCVCVFYLNVKYWITTLFPLSKFVFISKYIHFLSAYVIQIEEMLCTLRNNNFDLYTNTQ
jgi:hypothetical protein